MPVHIDIDLKWLERILINKSTNRGIVDILSTDIESAVPPGENYCSSIYKIKLKCALLDGSEKTLSLVVKQVITCDEENWVTESLPEMFAIEIKVYTFILPLMEKLMAEFKDEREKLWCHFYGHLDNQAIAFEDLTISDFKTMRRTDWLSFELSSLILKDLARFHAMSKILIDRGSIMKSDFAHNSTHADTEFGHNLHAGPLEVLADAILEWGSEWEVVAERVRLQVPYVTRKINELVDHHDDRYMVFNHGDVWTCNVMLKNSESNSVKSLR